MHKEERSELLEAHQDNAKPQHPNTIYTRIHNPSGDRCVTRRNKSNTLPRKGGVKASGPYKQSPYQAQKRWSSQIDWEALSLAYGMYMLRPYLVGNPVYTWVDPNPLVPLFNHRSRAQLVRITKLRHQVKDLNFTVNLFPGKQNSADYRSQYLAPIEEREGHMIEEEENITIMRVFATLYLWWLHKI